jgi:hypothetical protein
VIFLQTRDVILQRIDSGCRQHTSLAHAAAEYLAPAARLVDEFPRAAQHRTNRGTEPF